MYVRTVHDLCLALTVARGQKQMQLLMQLIYKSQTISSLVKVAPTFARCTLFRLINNWLQNSADTKIVVSPCNQLLHTTISNALLMLTK